MIKTKSVKSMPFYFSFFSFLCSISWTAYAIIRVEFYLLVSIIHLLYTVNVYKLSPTRLLSIFRFFISDSKCDRSNSGAITTNDLCNLLRVYLRDRYQKDKLDMVEKTVSTAAQKTSNDTSV